MVALLNIRTSKLPLSEVSSLVIRLLGIDIDACLLVVIPRIKIAPRSLTLKFTTGVFQLCCEAEGNPIPNVKWLKKIDIFNAGSPSSLKIVHLNNTENLTMRSCLRATLSNVESLWRLVGDYNCSASNGFQKGNYNGSWALATVKGITKIFCVHNKSMIFYS